MTIHWEELLCEGFETFNEMITNWHWEGDLTLEEMSDKLGVSLASLKRYLQKEKIKMQPSGSRPKEKRRKRNEKTTTNINC